MIIVDFQETQPAPIEAPAEEAAPVEEAPRPSRTLQPGQRQSMAALLGGTPAAAPATLAPMPMQQRLVTWLLIGGTLAGLLTALVLSARSAPARTPAPAFSLPTITRAAASPSVVATHPASAGVPIGHAVVAYDAPNGAPLGALDAATTYTPTGDLRDGWAQVDASGGAGRVWLRAADVPAVPTATAAPTATPEPTRPPVPTRPAYQAPVAPQPCTPERVVGSATDPVTHIRVDSCLSQAEAERALGALLAATAAAKGGTP
jgi:hypothetical protein